MLLQDKKVEISLYQDDSAISFKALYDSLTSLAFFSASGLNSPSIFKLPMWPHINE